MVRDRARVDRSVGAGEAGAPAHAAGLGSRVESRFRLNAAQPKTKSQSSFGNPRSFTFRRPAITLSQPKTGSIRGRHDWLIA